jgi:hypothetical protein
LLLVAFATSARAQGLPDVDEIDAEGLKLIILGKDGKRTGVLSGKTAKKSKDGQISISSAELIFLGGEEEIKLKAEELNYSSGSSEISYPKGMTVEMPDGAVIDVPGGTGSLTIEPNIVLHLESPGEMEFRTGDKDASSIHAKVPEPVFDLTVKRNDGGQELKFLKLKSDLGGEVDFGLIRMPVVGSNDASKPQKPAKAKITCFGPMELSVAGKDRLTSLHMQRRVSMKLESETDSLSINSTTLEVTGRQIGSDRDSPEMTAISELSMQASGNVVIGGNRINGFANEMSYEETGEQSKAERVLKLNGQPKLTIIEDNKNTEPSSPAGRLKLSAQHEITMRTPAADVVEQNKVHLQLLIQGRIQRFVGEQQVWQLFGKRVDVDTWRDENMNSSYKFDVDASGFAPVIRVQPVEDKETKRQLGRATVYGREANGQVSNDVGTFNVAGSEILVLSQLQQVLASQFRKNIGLEEGRADDGQSQLMVRANETVSLTIAMGENAGSDALSEFKVQAKGEVELDHQPLQRDDSRLVTMTGNDIALHVQGDKLKSAHIHGGTARISVGFDLLSCEQLDVYEENNVQKSSIRGPGTLYLRQTTTLKNLRKMLALLPRQTLGLAKGKDPDAGWIEFAGTVSIESNQKHYLMSMLQPKAYLVYGDFEPPRAGRTGFIDLRELRDPEVQGLFNASAGLLRVESRDVAGRAINVVSLVQNPVMDSALDGFRARALDSIVISGTEVDDDREVPFTVQIKVDAELTITNASEFLGEYVSDGVFAYDKSWQLTAGDFLEITTRPLDGLWSGEPTETKPGFGDVRGALRAANKLGNPHEMKLSLRHAQTLLDRATGEREPISGLPPLEVAQPRKAGDDFNRVFYTLHRATLESASSPERARLMRLAKSQTRSIHARLGSLVDISGSGGVDCFFHSSKQDVPSMSVSMQAFSLTFSGAGDLVGTDVTGPLVVRREGYTLRGSDVEGQFNGTLLLKDAELILPSESQIEVEGMDRITIRQSESRKERLSGERKVRRTIITRVTGKKLKVKVSLQDHNGEE